jgi:biotin carboxyl carrier protein
MKARSVVLEDSHGDQRRAEILSDGSVVIDGRSFTVKHMPDGSTRIGDDPPVVAWTAVSDDTRWVFVNGCVFTFAVSGADHAPAERSGSRRKRPGGHHGSLSAPMPATVRRIQVAPGDTVRRGDVLIILEAMKMELPVRAPRDGIVTAIRCREGELVQPGVILADIT